MVNSANLLFKGIKADFAGFMSVPYESAFKPFITYVKSKSNKEDFYIPESLPSIREWTDKRYYGEYADKKLTVYNKAYNNGVIVDRFTLDDVESTLSGILNAQIKDISKQVINFDDTLCQTLLDANSTAWDGTAFFATSRTNLDTGSNTINNLISGTSSTTYVIAEFEADFISAMNALDAMLDKNNNPFNPNAQYIALVPKHLKDLAMQLFSERATLIYDGTSLKSNIRAGSCEVVVNTKQTSTSDNDWYLINKDAAYKPFLIQDREAPKWDMIDNPEELFIKYGYYFRKGYAFLNPMSIVKVNN